MPSIVMMVFLSIYNMVDGLFVSNLVGKTEFAALNLALPLLMGLSTFGFMFGTGGGAIVGRLLGEKKQRAANEALSLFVGTTLVSGFVLLALGQLVLVPALRLMGGSGALLRAAVVYSRINLCSLPFFMVSGAFQSFFNTAGKPRLGMAVTVGTGCLNIGLDAWFIIGFHWGLAGAAIATTIAETLSGVIPLVYFSRENSSLLRFCRTTVNFRLIVEACVNGLSELMTNLSTSIVGIIYNLQLLRYYGENGVAAFGVVMYLQFVINSAFFGYSLGSGAILSYHYGAGDTKELQNLFRKTATIVLTANIVMFLIGEGAAGLMTKLFAAGDPELTREILHGERIYATAYIFMGIGIIGSAFFTALGNGIVSAAISLSRTLVFDITFVLLLPLLIGAEGIWWATLLVEFSAAVVTVVFLLKQNRHYHYLPPRRSSSRRTPDEP